MGKEAIDAIVSIVTAIIGLGILSVLVSRNANTTGVISAASSGLSADLSAAMSPVTGSSMGGLGGLSMPSIGGSSVIS